VPIGYAPIGSPRRPDRGRTDDDTVDIEDPVIVRIAQRLNVHPAHVCVAWAVQHGRIPILFSVKREQSLSNLHAAVSATLTGEDMNEIAGIDKNCRLIKGQVFLWKENLS
jgi:alcohol dehydrogenase (NADP+)